MVYSAEIRWFFKGVINNNILQYFKDKQIIFREEPPRSDWYMLHNDRFTGIKLRNGNIEIKKSTSDFRSFQIIPEIRGNAGNWMKFVFGQVDNGEKDAVLSGRNKHWMRVDKSRSVVKYELPDSQTLVPVSAESRPGEAILLEICFVKALNLDFWTLGIEAYGREENTAMLLETGSRLMFPDSRGIEFLKNESSYHYPEFISKLSLL